MQSQRMRMSAQRTSLQELPNDTRRLIVSAVGYEPRCTHVVAQISKHWDIPPSQLGQTLLLLEFKSHRNLATRVEAQGIFDTFAPKYRYAVDEFSGPAVRAEVGRIARELDVQHIVVDYSCLSRSLYLCLLALVSEGFRMSFLYSVGDYGTAEKKYPVSAVGEIRTVPGFEGIPHPSRPKLYVIGLGFDGIGTKALLDKLEAGRLVVFWTDPGASARSSTIAVEANEMIIERALARFTTDLRDVNGTVAILRRLAIETAGSDQMILVPVGPKPHVLACGLLAAEFEHVTLLAPYLGTGRGGEDPPRIRAAGEIIVSEVSGVSL